MFLISGPRSLIPNYPHRHLCPPSNRAQPAAQYQFAGPDYSFDVGCIARSGAEAGRQQRGHPAPQRRHRPIVAAQVAGGGSGDAANPTDDDVEAADGNGLQRLARNATH